MSFRPSYCPISSCMVYTGCRLLLGNLLALGVESSLQAIMLLMITIQIWSFVPLFFIHKSNFFILLFHNDVAPSCRHFRMCVLSSMKVLHLGHLSVSLSFLAYIALPMPNQPDVCLTASRRCPWGRLFNAKRWLSQSISSRDLDPNLPFFCQ